MLQTLEDASPAMRRLASCTPQGGQSSSHSYELFAAIRK